MARVKRKKDEKLFEPVPKTRRRRRLRPFNHSKNVSKRDTNYNSKKKKRGQGN